MATREPSQNEVTSYFKAMAEGKIQVEDVGNIGKPVGGRSNRVIHYRMTYPNGPVNLPVQKISTETQQAVAQAKEEAKAELGIKGNSTSHHHHSRKRKRKNNIQFLRRKKSKK